jgi:hypothetical protein
MSSLLQHLDINSFNVLVGLFGPLLVAAVTGLRTPSWVKATLSVLTGSLVAVGTVYFTKGLSGDYVANVVSVAVVWQTSYSMLWKGTGVATWLQASVPLSVGENASDLIYVPTGTPEQTDNSTRPEDGDQTILPSDLEGQVN